jgi:hypothetical protein
MVGRPFKAGELAQENAVKSRSDVAYDALLNRRYATTRIHS